MENKQEALKHQVEAGRDESEQEVDHQERPAKDRYQGTAPMAPVEQGEKEDGCYEDEEVHQRSVALLIRSARGAGETRIGRPNGVSPAR